VHLPHERENPVNIGDILANPDLDLTYWIVLSITAHGFAFLTLPATTGHKPLKITLAY